MDLSECRIKLKEAKTKQDLYEIAGFLNNRPEHQHADKVTFMAFLDFNKAVEYVERLINESVKRSKGNI